jgi:hypothetical protein
MRNNHDSQRRDAATSLPNAIVSVLRYRVRQFTYPQALINPATLAMSCGPRLGWQVADPFFAVHRPTLPICTDPRPLSSLKV